MPATGMINWYGREAEMLGGGVDVAVGAGVGDGEGNMSDGVGDGATEAAGLAVGVGVNVALGAGVGVALGLFSSFVRPRKYLIVPNTISKKAPARKKVIF